MSINITLWLFIFLIIIKIGLLLSYWQSSWADRRPRREIVLFFPLVFFILVKKASVRLDKSFLLINYSTNSKTFLIITKIEIFWSNWFFLSIRYLLSWEDKAFRLNIAYLGRLAWIDFFESTSFFIQSFYEGSFSKDYELKRFLLVERSLTFWHDGWTQKVIGVKVSHRWNAKGR